MEELLLWSTGLGILASMIGGLTGIGFLTLVGALALIPLSIVLFIGAIGKLLGF